jgi:predicted NAD/FAD-dependent oxidoreductase
MMKMHITAPSFKQFLLLEDPLEDLQVELWFRLHVTKDKAMAHELTEWDMSGRLVTTYQDQRAFKTLSLSADGKLLLAAAADWLGAGVRTFQVHGWRYSQPKFRDTEPCVLVNHAPPLALAGDAFGGGGVEGAALSGRAAAQAILALETGSHRA